MPNGTTAAVTEAARLEEIGFPEFTAKLVTDTYDALVAANARQTGAYMALLTAVGQTLTFYISATKDDIRGEDILKFLAAAAPPRDPKSGNPTQITTGQPLNADEANAVNEALETKDAGIANDNKVAPAKASLTDADVKSISEAAAKRLAANRYDLLKEMVKQGVLRLVVENGVIESKLTFTTYGSTFYQRNSATYHTDGFEFRAAARSGPLTSLWINSSTSLELINMTVRTVSDIQRDISGSSVQIFGRVELNFKTDYQALA
jgi:hypothetical protein